MTTPFKKALEICGLSQGEAADFLNVRLDTVKSWCADRNRPPPGVWLELSQLYTHMNLAAIETLDQVEQHGGPEDVNFRYSGDHRKWPNPDIAVTIEAMAKLKFLAGPAPLSKRK